MLGYVLNSYQSVGFGLVGDNNKPVLKQTTHPAGGPLIPLYIQDTGLTSQKPNDLTQN